MSILYIPIHHIVSVTYDTRSGPTDLGSTIADDDCDLYTSHIPELYTYRSGVTSFHRTRNTIARQIAGTLFA